MFRITTVQPFFRRASQSLRRKKRVPIAFRVAAPLAPARALPPATTVNPYLAGLRRTFASRVTGTSGWAKTTFKQKVVPADILRALEADGVLLGSKRGRRDVTDTQLRRAGRTAALDRYREVEAEKIALMQRTPSFAADVFRELAAREAAAPTLFPDLNDDSLLQQMYSRRDPFYGTALYDASSLPRLRILLTKAVGPVPIARELQRYVNRLGPLRPMAIVGALQELDDKLPLLARLSNPNSRHAPLFAWLLNELTATDREHVAWPTRRAEEVVSDIFDELETLILGRVFA